MYRFKIGDVVQSRFGVIAIVTQCSLHGDMIGTIIYSNSSLFNGGDSIYILSDVEWTQY